MDNIFLLPHARTNWQHVFTDGPGVMGRSIPCPRGKLLGGSTSVNGTVSIRGHPLDYDDWAAQGNPGWAYADVLPFFKRHEHCDRGAHAGVQCRRGRRIHPQPARAGPACRAGMATSCTFVPVEMKFGGYIAHRHVSAAASDVPGKALRVQRVVGQPVQALALHMAAALTQNAPNSAPA